MAMSIRAHSLEKQESKPYSSYVYFTFWNIETFCNLFSQLFSAVVPVVHQYYSASRANGNDA